MQLPEPQAENNQNELFSKYMVFDDNQWAYLQKYFNLTSSERNITELMCQGLSEEGIARHMNIQRGTVKTHARNIYRKMHVKNKIMMLLNFINIIREQSQKVK